MGSRLQLFASRRQVQPDPHGDSLFARDGTRPAQDAAKYDQHGVIRPSNVQISNLFAGKNQRRAKFGVGELEFGHDLRLGYQPAAATVDPANRLRSGYVFTLPPFRLCLMITSAAAFSAASNHGHTVALDGAKPCL